MARIERIDFDVICDICGDEADFNHYWHSVEYLGGAIVGEYSSPIDLCTKHNELYASKYSDNYKKERYDTFSEKKVNELIKKMKYDDKRCY